MDAYRPGVLTTALTVLIWTLPILSGCDAFRKRESWQGHQYTSADVWAAPQQVRNQLRYQEDAALLTGDRSGLPSKMPSDRISEEQRRKLQADFAERIRSQARKQESWMVQAQRLLEQNTARASPANAK